MSKALPGEHYCRKHQGNEAHYDEKNCTVCKLLASPPERERVIEECARVCDAEASQLIMRELPGWESQRRSAAAIRALSVAPQETVPQEKGAVVTCVGESRRKPTAPAGAAPTVAPSEERYETFGYALAMAVLQSPTYAKLDDKARAECDELIARGRK